MKKRSRCYSSSTANDTKYGCLYTWAATVDSAGKWSMSGKGCGNRKTCTLTNPVRGICPEGWHIPTSVEWEALYSSMDRSPYAMQAKGLAEWTSATDAYGFSALPLGSYYVDVDNGQDFGRYAYFWSATESDDDSYRAGYWYLGANTAGLGDGGKAYGHSVRCLQDSP